MVTDQQDARRRSDERPCGALVAHSPAASRTNADRPTAADEAARRHGRNARVQPGRSLVAAIGRKHTPGASPPLGFAAVWRTSDGTLLWKQCHGQRPRRHARLLAGWTSARAQLRTVVFERGHRRGRELALGCTRADDPAGRSQARASPTRPTARSRQAPRRASCSCGIAPRRRNSAIRLLAMPAPIASISFDRTGNEFATGGGSGGFVKLWDTKTLQQVGSPLPGSPGKWANALFTADGSHLLTLYDDGKGALWPSSLTSCLEGTGLPRRRAQSHPRGVVAVRDGSPLLDGLPVGTFVRTSMRFPTVRTTRVRAAGCRTDL